MQACRLSLAEVTHPAKVVKVWLDPSSQSLALMLSDSTCLLYSLKFPSIAVQIPAPVTDGCFLRLLQKRKLKLPQKTKPRRVGAAQYDRGIRKEGGVAEGTVVFLATMPARGGSRTVIRAWSREGDSSFSPSLVEMKDVGKVSKLSEGLGKRAAAVLDLPHGFAVKIAASVNVFVVHSASAGKIWVMAAKVKQVDEELSKLGENFTESKQFAGKLEGFSGKLVGTSLKSDHLNGGIHSNSETLRSSDGRWVCISLIKCSVVDCTGPVYSIRVSLQHMILGEENGVRVWALRPLVKGRLKKKTLVREKFKQGLTASNFEDLDKGNRQRSCVESGLKTGVLDQGSSLESDMELCCALNGRKLGALTELNLQTNNIESLENGKLEALDQRNLQASFVEGNTELISMDSCRAFNHLNFQANSVEGNSQLNSMANGMKIRGLNGENSMEYGKEAMCLMKGGKKAIEGEGLILDNFLNKYNVEIDCKESLALNGGERVNLKRVHVGKVCEENNDCQTLSDFGELNLDEKVDGGKEAGLTLKKFRGNGVTEDAIGGCKDVSEIYCNGANTDFVPQVSSPKGLLPASCEGFGDAMVNSVNGVRCNCSNSISQGVTDVGLEVGNLVIGTMRQCEAKCFPSKRRNGQLFPNTASLDDSSIQQQLSQKSSSSSAASSFSGSVAPCSASTSARASSVLGSTNSSEGTSHAPVPSLIGKCRSSQKMRDTLGKVCSSFVPFEDAGKEGNKALHLRAIAIHALSQTKFVVLDSAGDLHILSLHNLVSTIDGQKEQDCVTAGQCFLRHLKCSLKVNMLATFPETSSTTSQKLWVSDGRHSIHLLSFPNVSTSLGGSDKDPVDENPLQLSVMQAVFLSDRIRAIASISANATLVLTQGSIITYTIAGS